MSTSETGPANKTATTISIPASMPSPPEFLMKRPATKATSGFGTEIPANFADDFEVEPRYQGRSYTPPPSQIPKNVDYLVYQSAIDDRRTAETTYAEIYSKYLELVAFNEKLLRSLHAYERFRGRVRNVYRRALLGTEAVNGHHYNTQQSLRATEKTVTSLQLDNESLRATIKIHEENFQKIVERMGEGEATMESANRHFQILAQEYENRGILLDEADRKIREYLAQMQQMGISIKEIQEKNVTARDENLILQNQNRELQLREAAVSTLNSEMATSLTKAQKQIHQLEEKLRTEREQYETRLAVLEDDLGRFREDRRANELINMAREVQKNGPSPAAAEIQVTAEAKAAPPGANSRPADRAQWNDFYNKWSQIIGELSSHSTPLRKLEKEPAADKKQAQAGELEPLVEPEFKLAGHDIQGENFADQWAEISDLEIL